MQKVIAIDGPSASGKGTVAARVAAQLGWHYLDSGALYRLTALAARQAHIDWHNETAVAQIAEKLPVHFHNGQIFLSDQDVSQTIRQEDIGMGASTVAALPAVRQALLQRQRDFLNEQGLVADGRDMGSVVFPQAMLKIFLTADARIRAERRALQAGLPTEGDAFEQIHADIQRRDQADRNRASAPLMQHPDSLLLDTSHLTIDEAVTQVLTWYRAKSAV